MSEVALTSKTIAEIQSALARGSDVRIENTKYGIRIIELKVRVLAKQDEKK